MKRKDYLLIALVPLAVLVIPLVGVLTSPEWQWTWRDFVVAWVILAATTAFYRLLVTRPVANLAYRAGVALAIAGGFLITWVTLAVQIIGDDNPGNLLYLGAILGGGVGVGFARFQPAGLARVAFGLAAVLVLIPAVSVLLWPADFNPGYAKVQFLSTGFAALFALAGLLFRHAASQSSHAATSTI